MTKKEFIEKMANMPDDAEMYFWNFTYDAWTKAEPYFIKGERYDYDSNGEHIHNFIGIQ